MSSARMKTMFGCSAALELAPVAIVRNPAARMESVWLCIDSFWDLMGRRSRGSNVPAVPMFQRSHHDALRPVRQNPTAATDGSVRLLLQNGDDIQLPGSARLASSIPKTGPADSHRLRRPTQKPSEFRRLGLSGCHIPPPSPPNLADEPKLHCAATWKA